MDRLASRLILVVAAATACAPAASAPSASPTPTIRTAAPASPTPVAPPTIQPPTGITPRPGGCTSAQVTTRALLDRYFSLTTTGDVGAVLDCFAKTLREHQDMESSARRWSTAGRIMNLDLAFMDRVNACDRYRATWDFAVEDPFHPNPWLIYYTVGLESGAPRIYDGATAAVAPEYATVICEGR